MDDVPIDICIYILEFTDCYSTWCRLSSRYYIIYHEFLRRRYRLLGDIVMALCKNGNLDYLKYILTLAQIPCDQCKLYRCIYSGDDSPTRFRDIDSFRSREISCAIRYNHIEIVNYLTTILPQYIVVSVDVHDSIEIIPQLLDNSKLFVIGISTAIANSLLKVNDWENNLELMLTLIEWIEKIKLHKRLLQAELVPISIIESSIRTIAKKLIV